MKDYYQILGISRDCNQEDIKGAFRKLAFKYHPDTNPGNEKSSEEMFKEINEAYAVLGDKERRQQYDAAGQWPFVNAGYDGKGQGFGYSQQDIFMNSFSNRAMFTELNKMFTQAGLRFDQDFLNRTFFAGSGVKFQAFTGRGEARSSRYSGRTSYQQSPQASAYKQGFIERWLSKMAIKFGQFVLVRLIGFQPASLNVQRLDYHYELEISAAEAVTSGEKQVTYKRNGQLKKLMVKVPARVKTGTKIRLKNMGMTENGKSGDLYLHVKIKG
ncbi:DnaJ domain-containing protein [Chloroflexota bacterium]